MIPSEVLQLRCLANRVAEMAARYGYDLPHVQETLPYIDPALPSAIADVIGWVDTMWEVRALLAIGGYPDVLRASIFANLFLSLPNVANLQKYGVSMTGYLAAAAQMHGINKPCGVTAFLPGLVPLASSTLNPAPVADPDGGVEDTDDDIPEPDPPPLRHHAMLQPSRPFGHVVMGSMLVTAAGLVTSAVTTQLKGEHQILKRKRR